MKNAIEINNLTKKYDEKFELNIEELTVPSGKITGLIGENGAGKTTLIKSMLDIIKRDNGSIKIFDKDNLEAECEIKEDIGVVLDNLFFPELLNANDINSIMKSTYKNWDSNMYYNYLDEMNIPKDKNIKSLSTGMKKKLEISVALSHKPKLLILDEPTSGLDPIVRNEILDIFLKFISDDEHSILLSTHITSDLDQIADDIIFIDKGKKVFEDSEKNIKENYGILKCSLDDFKKIDEKDIVKYKKNKHEYEILINNRNELSKKYKDFEIEKITLENLMILMIKGEK